MATIKKAQAGITAKKPVVKVVEKKTTVTPKPKTASQKIGDITLRDVKNAGEDALNLSTLGGYSKIKKALGGEYKYKKLGEKKYGGSVKKAQYGNTVRGLGLMGENSRKVSPNKSKYVSEDGNYKMKFKGGSDENMTPPTSAVQRRTLKGFLKGAPKAAGKMALKSGGSMKKCKYGCK